MRRGWLISTLALVVGAALAVSACGGDDSPEVPIIVPTDSTTGSLVKADFIKEADALCRETNAAIGRFVASGEGFTASGEIGDLREALAKDIQDLGPPTDDQATLDQFLAALQAQAVAGGKIALANQRGEDTTQFEAELDAAKTEAATAAQAYGFTECGQEVSAVDPTTADGSSSDASSGAGAPVAPAPAPSSGGATGSPDTSGDTGSGGGVSPGGGISP